MPMCFSYNFCTYAPIYQRKQVYPYIVYNSFVYTHICKIDYFLSPTGSKGKNLIYVIFMCLNMQVLGL